MVVNDETTGYECGSPKCTFRISKQKFDDIVNDMYKVTSRGPINREYEENLEELNNL